MKSKRIQWLDFAKGLTILFVVLAHCASIPKFNIRYPIIKLFAYLSLIFVMPVFFSISGYLYKKINTVHDYYLLLYKKSISLLIPYFIISLLYSICDLIFYQQPITILNVIFGFNTNISLWFLVSLFIIFVIVGLFDLLHLNRNILYFISLFILLISKNFWNLNNSKPLEYATLYIIYSYLIFFCLGLFIKQHKTFFYNTFINKKWFIGYSILFILSFMLSRKGIHETDYITITTLFVKLLSVLLAFSIFINFNENNIIFKYFDIYGKYTLIIYLIHFPIAFDLGKILPSRFYIFLFLLIVSWLFSIFVCYLSTQSKVVNFIFYPRKYINEIILKTEWGKNLLDR